MRVFYRPPHYFVTVDGNPASQAVLQQLCSSQAKLSPALQGRYFFITQSTPDLLLASFVDIPTHLTVALYDVSSDINIKHYRPLHLTQPDTRRPVWASQPLWSVAIRTDKAQHTKVIRDCAQEMAAWFTTGIQRAIPGHSYPWGPVPARERNSALQRLAQEHAH